MASTANSTDELFARVFPAAEKLKTDHGGMNLGDIIVIILDLVLFLYTGYRSWHFLSMSIPGDFQIMAIIGLWGLDIGMIAWSIIWMYGSTTTYQNWASMTLFVLDLLGVILTSVVDTLMYSQGATVPPVMQAVAWYGIPAIIIANVAAGFLYHMTSPETRRRRAERAQDEELSKQREFGDLELRRMNLQLNQAQAYTENRTKFLIAFSSVAEQNLALAEIEKALMHALNQTGDEVLSGISGSGLNIPGLPARKSSKSGAGVLDAALSRVRSMTNKQAPEDHKTTQPRPITPDTYYCLRDGCQNQTQSGQLYCSPACEIADAEENLRIAMKRVEGYRDGSIQPHNHQPQAAASPIVLEPVTVQMKLGKNNNGHTPDPA